MSELLPDFDAEVRQPRARATLINMSTGATATLQQNDLVSLSILRERRVEGSGVPYGTMAAHELILDFLRNASIPNSMYGSNTKIIINLGTRKSGVESYVQCGVFYATTWDLSNKEYVSVIAHDWRYKLSDVNYSRVDNFNTLSVGELINDVMITAAIPGAAWKIEGLSYIPPVVAIPDTTCFKAITMLLSACDGVSVMDNEGVATIKDNSYSDPEKVLDGSNHIINGLANPVDKSTIATAVIVNWYTYKNSDESVTVINSNETIKMPPRQSVKLTIDWASPDIVCTVSDNWGIDFQYTVSPAEYTLYAMITSVTRTADGLEFEIMNQLSHTTLTITNITAKDLVVKATKHQYELRDSAAVELYGEAIYTVDNTLIQSLEQAKAVAEAILKYNNPLKTWKFTSRCDPNIYPDKTVIAPNLDDGWSFLQMERQEIQFGVNGPGLKETRVDRYIGDVLEVASGIDTVMSGDDQIISIGEGGIYYGSGPA